LSCSLLLPHISSDNKSYHCPFTWFPTVKGDLQKKWTELVEFTLEFKKIVQKFANFFVKKWQNNSERKIISLPWILVGVSSSSSWNLFRTMYNDISWMIRSNNKQLMVCIKISRFERHEILSNPESSPGRI